MTTQRKQPVNVHSAGRRNTSFGDALGRLRGQLVDTSKRSRLINTRLDHPRSRKQLDICDERADQVFRRLFVQRRLMRFKGMAGGFTAADDADTGQFYLPSGKSADARHVDHWLQTMLTEEALHKRLLTLYRDARSVEEEQGVNVLFLALGFVKWYESASSQKERYAPLILLPVSLERDSAKSQFKLECRDQDLESNLSLKALLKADFEVVLPDFPDGESWLPSDYYAQVNAVLSTQQRWRLLPDAMQLGFYSFAKFLMYNDLEGADLQENDFLLDKLLVHGFETGSSNLGGDENLDAQFKNPKDLGHILEADASQTRIIDAARRGSNLVVQGPPGTGKSQTIANIIASAVADGKTVLFVAEKRAALDVVHTRLEKCDLGPVCLELHSRKVSKRHFYAELKRTLELGEPKAVHESEYERVARVRDELNAINALLHAVDAQSGQTPYNIMGILSNFRASGLPRPDYAIEGIDSWQEGEYAERKRLAANLAELTRRHGTELHHMWRGAQKRLGPIDQDRLRDKLRDACTRLQVLHQAYGAAAAVLGLTDGRLAATVRAREHLVALQERPHETADLLQQNVVVEEPHEVRALFEAVEECQQRAGDLLETVIRSALKRSWEAERIALVAPAHWLARLFGGRYRAARGTLRGVCSGKPPRKHGELVRLVDRLVEHEELRERIRRDSALARAVLGRHWREEHTDVTSILPAIRWIADHSARLGSGAAVVKQLSGLPADADLGQLAHDLKRSQEAWNQVWHAIREAVELEVSTAFGSDTIGEVPFDGVLARLRAWSEDIGGINIWHQLLTAAREATELGMDAIRKELAAGRLAPHHASDTLTFIWAEATWKRLCRQHAALNEISGHDRTRKVEEFKRFDQTLQVLAAQEAMRTHFLNIPQGASGAMGLVRGEAGKKSRHLSIRGLLERAAAAVQLIKPVFLMSPLSVAQYLPKGKVKFDMLLIDEASQVRPADAVGAITRAKQIIVVGDQKQLPPTSFFDRQVSADAEEGEGHDLEDMTASQVDDMESILSLCDARGMPGGMLQWHYRSSHPSLIAVSNHTFYDDKLICPPSPESVGREAGLTFTNVSGEYLRGTKRTNPMEADVVVQAVLEHARAQPSETLGVVALSVAQRDEIRNRIEFQRTQYPELEAFCSEEKEDPFFVKNLENVQGDERDAIFVSIGYGRDAGGYMSQSFGPISSEGGERRLNVLFTRSKKRCRIFSSIRHSDIRLDAAKHLGPRVLARYLKYAETGEMDIPTPTGGDTDSPFEDSVLRVLQRYGYTVALQVGSAGFRIDLAVCHPEDAGRYILAIECDGARYHSSSWARERDRLRQIVLESKGWIFHRIWSTDWFQDQEGETRKLIGAIERAKVRVGSDPERPAPPRPKVQRTDYDPDKGAATVPYVMADPILQSAEAVPIHEASTSYLAGIVKLIVDVEGPVHKDIVCRRINGAWGNTRMGNRIREALDHGIARAVKRNLIRMDSTGVYLDRHDRSDPVRPRDRSELESGADRSSKVLPPAEIRAAALEVVRRSLSVTPDECAKEMAGMFGYRSLTKSLRERFVPELNDMVHTGALVQDGGYLRSGSAG